MERNNISDYGSIDSKKFLDDFVREYSEVEKENTKLSFKLKVNDFNWSDINGK